MPSININHSRRPAPTKRSTSKPKPAENRDKAKKPNNYHKDTFEPPRHSRPAHRT
ncbi:hypothetical protein [Archangium violaceum]|uniref:hypothetical protein n=1 Tax=Archangium violaceum TaxID=83451 RepID=UPI0037BEA781